VSSPQGEAEAEVPRETPPSPGLAPRKDELQPRPQEGNEKTPERAKKAPRRQGNRSSGRRVPLPPQRPVYGPCAWATGVRAHRAKALVEPTGRRLLSSPQGEGSCRAHRAKALVEPSGAALSPRILPRESPSTKKFPSVRGREYGGRKRECEGLPGGGPLHSLPPFLEPIPRALHAPPRST